MAEKKKILIIASVFHSSHRISGILKYLLPMGFEATVITIPASAIPSYYLGKKTVKDFEKINPEAVRIIETGYRGDIFSGWRRILKLFGFRREGSLLEQVKRITPGGRQRSLLHFLFGKYCEIFAYPDEEKKWKNPALRAAREILKKEKFDIILSSSSPVSAHLVACELKKEFGLPWIADLRDPWSQNHNYNFGKIRHYFDERLEKETLGAADALVIVSPFAAAQLKNLHREKEVYAITNGYDPENENRNPDGKVSDKFLIVYAGQIYRGKQDPSMILRSVKELISEGKIEEGDLEIVFCGPATTGLDSMINDLGLQKIARQAGVIGADEAYEKERRSQLLLLLMWGDLEMKAGYPLKFFDYLAAKRPIIATGGAPDNEVAILIKESGVGKYCETAKDTKAALLDFYSEYKRAGLVKYGGRQEKIEDFSQLKMAEKFKKLIDKLTAK